VARPESRFNDFIGQRKSVGHLRRQLEGALARGEPFPHSLFTGTSGLGKTFLASAMAAEYKTAVHEAMGDIDRYGLAGKLVALKPSDFLLIDECHLLHHSAQELLMRAIDTKRVPALTRDTNGKKLDQPCKDIEIQPWTLILATDQPGRLLNALRKRIVIHEHLRPYSLKELREIVEYMAGQQNLLISHQAAGDIARASMGIARNARMRLQSLRLQFIDAEKRQLGRPEVREYLRSAGISQTGMDRLQRSYLRELAKRSNAALEAMARILGIDESYVQQQIETPLLRRGLVQIDSRGRQLTPKGKDLVAHWLGVRQEKGQETLVGV